MTMSPSKKRGRPAKKKVGRPLGSKNKPKKITLSASEVGFAKTMNVPLGEFAKVKLTKSKPAAASRASFKQAEHQRALHNIVDENLRLLEENQQFRNQIASLNHQIVGFRAVISYLENRLDVPSSQ
jgi:hypothetical protein